MQQSKPLFELGEVAILQPPHPSARAYWGMLTVVLRRVWHSKTTDAFGGAYSGWSYQTDVAAPPATDEPADQHEHWLWCEYDLRKKYDPGMDFTALMDELNKSIETEAMGSE